MVVQRFVSGLFGNPDYRFSRDSVEMFFAGATLEFTIIIGILKTSGIFFVNFQKRFDSTSSMTSLISTVQNGVYSVGGGYLHYLRPMGHSPIITIIVS